MGFSTSGRKKQRRRRYSPPPDLPWYRPRGYRHFDPPVEEAQARRLASDLSWVAKHAFFPFIRYEKVERRYQWPKRRSGQPRRPIPKNPKRRPIAFAAHTDTIVFSIYGAMLNELYEARLAAEGLSECLLAYRKFPGEPRCNVHFARDAFRLVDGKQLDMLIGLDVEAFFDSIDHARLKEAWCELLGVGCLPVDHYRVYRAITKYAYVERRDLLGALKMSLRQFSAAGGRRLCSAQEFRDLIRDPDYVEHNKEGYGIPQGSPMSAVLSNIFMLPFDRDMKEFCDGLNAVYRRYSDDILIVCRSSDQEIIETFAAARIGDLGLKINPNKTTVAQFRKHDDLLETKKPFQYLGLIFDGQRMLIRSKSLAKYHRRTDRAVAKARRNAIQAKAEGGERKLRRTAIFEKSSHLGLKDNFPAYITRTRQILGEQDAEGVRQQFKSHWPRLNRRLRKADRE